MRVIVVGDDHPIRDDKRYHDVRTNSVVIENVRCDNYGGTVSNAGGGEITIIEGRLGGLHMHIGPAFSVQLSHCADGQTRIKLIPVSSLSPLERLADCSNE